MKNQNVSDPYANIRTRLPGKTFPKNLKSYRIQVIEILEQFHAEYIRLENRSPVMLDRSLSGCGTSCGPRIGDTVRRVFVRDDNNGRGKKISAILTCAFTSGQDYRWKLKNAVGMRANRLLSNSLRLRAERAKLNVSVN